MRSGNGTPDPQWEFTLLIRAALEAEGTYAIEVDTRDAQSVADIHWAARQAGRLLGARVKVEVSYDGHADAIATATVHCVQTEPAQRAAAQNGLDRLLQRVQAEQEQEAARLAGALQLGVSRPRVPLARVGVGVSQDA